MAKRTMACIYKVHTMVDYRGGSSSRSSSSASSYAARARAGAAAALLPFGQAQEQSRQTVASLSGQ